MQIVMYHYVRDRSDVMFPNLPVRTLNEFNNQVLYLKKRFNIISIHEAIDAIVNGEPKDMNNSVILSFDDGYLDHYINVLPVLVENDLSGIFFPVVCSSRDFSLLSVNRIQFLLAAVKDHGVLREKMDMAILESQSEVGLKSPEEYWEIWSKGGRWDSAETFYIKRMLQRGLPRPFAYELAKDFFKRFVTDDERGFAEQLYMSETQIEEMVGHGMVIGNHTNSHPWLTELSHSEVREEIRSGVEWLSKLGQSVQNWVMCYPFGGHSDQICDIAQQEGAVLGLTVDHGDIGSTSVSSMRLPRIDTNCLPY